MRYLLAICFFLAGMVFAGESPFSATLEWGETDGVQTLIARLEGPAGGHLVAENTELLLPEGYSGERVDTLQPDAEGNYPTGSVLCWRITPPMTSGEAVLWYQGCTDTMCYRPQKVIAESSASRAEALPQALPLAPLSPLSGRLRERRQLLHYEDCPSRAEALAQGGEGVPNTPEFRISEPLCGYASADDFLAWLSRAQSGEAPSEANLLERVFARFGWALAALLTIGLGVLLNLTPCVLPMIPITLGVLGARSAGQGRGRGLALGGTYGLAMALTYGIAGAIVVALGGRVGAINSSAIFQFVLAVIFLLLALSMFDCFFLDFTRFRKGGMGQAGSYTAAAFLGVMAALMAGACIAPVLIWVLLLSARLYAGGTTAALWLPLLLGVGLGLPWPLLGAGVGSLPKPGAWMNYTKKAVGVVILLFAIYTAWNGVKLIRSDSGAKDDLWRSDYQACLEEARQTGKPVLLDFWGVSCKACTMMDATTLREPRVREELQKCLCVSIQGDAGEGAALAEQFGVLGFPTYIVITFPKCNCSGHVLNQIP